jgi:TPR repeat protein
MDIALYSFYIGIFREMPLTTLRFCLVFLSTLALATPASAGDDAQRRGLPMQAITVRQLVEIVQAATRAMERDIDTARQKRFAAITALHDGRCKEALDYFRIDDGKAISTRWILLRAHMHWRGLCFEQDSTEAARILQYAIDDNPHFADAMALLGALYWRGDGVPMDQSRARALFRSAMLNKGPWLLASESGPSTSYGELAEVRYWNLSETGLERAFTEGVVGPWELPEPMTRQLAWFDSLKSDGAKVMAVAFALRDGRDGYPKDPVLAFKWLRAASIYMKYGPADVPYAEALRDDALFALRSADSPSIRQGSRKGEYLMANSALLRAAKRGDIRAERAILRLLKAGPDYTQKNWAVYYWLLRLKSHGDDISPAELENAKAKVEPEDLRWIEKWDERHAQEGEALTPLFTSLSPIP